MSNRGTFCCLEHNHTNAIEEIECSATFQLDQAEAEIERLTAALTYIAYPQYDDRKYELMAAARAALEEEK